MPARSSKTWLGATASAGVSFSVGIRAFDQRTVATPADRRMRDRAARWPGRAPTEACRSLPDRERGRGEHLPSQFVPTRTAASIVSSPFRVTSFIPRPRTAPKPGIGPNFAALRDETLTRKCRSFRSACAGSSGPCRRIVVDSPQDQPLDARLRGQVRIARRTGRPRTLGRREVLGVAMGIAAHAPQRSRRTPARSPDPGALETRELLAYTPLGYSLPDLTVSGYTRTVAAWGGR